VLEDDALAVLEVISRVTDLAPYHALADSLRQRYPDLSSGTLRALVLSLSPAADDARAWLRGEADQILEERLRVLRLGECSPDPGDVIRAVATLRQVSVPLVLCLDQLDELYLGSLVSVQGSRCSSGQGCYVCSVSKVACSDDASYNLIRTCNEYSTLLT
jgi:hypothetical protein